MTVDAQFRICSCLFNIATTCSMSLHQLTLIVALLHQHSQDPLKNRDWMSSIGMWNFCYCLIHSLHLTSTATVPAAIDPRNTRPWGTSPMIIVALSLPDSSTCCHHSSTFTSHPLLLSHVVLSPTHWLCCRSRPPNMMPHHCRYLLVIG